MHCHLRVLDLPRITCERGSSETLWLDRCNYLANMLFLVDWIEPMHELTNQLDVNCPPLVARGNQ